MSQMSGKNDMRYAWLICFWLTAAVQAQDWRAAEKRMSIPELDSLPKVSVISKSAESVKVRVENTTPVDLSYSALRTVPHPPLYWEEKIFGEWKGTEIPFCGFGWESLRLVRGSHVDFEIPLEEKKNSFRISMCVSEEGTVKRSYVLLYEGP